MSISTKLSQYNIEELKKEFTKLISYNSRLQKLHQIRPDCFFGIENHQFDKAWIKKNKTDLQDKGPKKVKILKECITDLSILTTKSKRTLERGINTFFKKNFNLKNCSLYSRNMLVFTSFEEMISSIELQEYYLGLEKPEHNTSLTHNARKRRSNNPQMNHGNNKIKPQTKIPKLFKPIVTNNLDNCQVTNGISFKAISDTNNSVHINNNNNKKKIQLSKNNGNIDPKPKPNPKSKNKNKQKIKKNKNQFLFELNQIPNKQIVSHQKESKNKKIEKTNNQQGSTSTPIPKDNLGHDLQLNFNFDLDLNLLDNSDCYINEDLTDRLNRFVENSEEQIINLETLDNNFTPFLNFENDMTNNLLYFGNDNTFVGDQLNNEFGNFLQEDRVFLSLTDFVGQY
ncbi:hypothetical protein M0813_05452 [Anaeramoeba flamelloides]|uniref:Uncharacterized protein n=1 Tax=Anaeramoeba flamelloides TaxID=1746091 RepID=A0ABQ8XGZ4_9EUKA|nr:hypothetical protein M0813_05452 [Anaeramoeba flamelloides]